MLPIARRAPLILLLLAGCSPPATFEADRAPSSARLTARASADELAGPIELGAPVEVSVELKRRGNYVVGNLDLHAARSSVVATVVRPHGPKPGMLYGITQCCPNEF